MSRTIVLPHLAARAEDVSPGPWFLLTPSGAEPVPAVLPGWDYLVNLELSCRVQLDVAGIRATTALAAAPLGLLAVWRSTATRIQRRSAIAVVGLSDGRQDYELRLSLPGAELGGSLHLERQLVLLEDLTHGPDFSAKRAGSILWREGRGGSTTVDLEGAGALFPTEIVDFATIPQLADPDAVWVVEIDGDQLDAAALGSVRLYLNARNPDVEAIRAGRTDARTKAVASALRWDVARSLILAALESDELDDTTDYGDGSLGTALQHVVHSHVPTYAIPALRALRRSSPHRFESIVQAKTALFQEASQ